MYLGQNKVTQKSRLNGIRHIALTIITVGLLAGCSGEVNSDIQSPLNMLQKATIYYNNSERDANSELRNNELYIDMSDDEQKDFITYNTNISIKDSGDLTIQVNNADYTMSIWSKHEGHTKRLYDLILKTLKEDKSKYLMLYSHLITDNAGNIENIRYDIQADKIIFDFARF